MSEIPEKLQDAAADVAAEVAQQAEGAEKVIRSLNQIKVQFGLMGVAVGSAIGAMASFTIAYRRAQTKYSQITDEEIAEMRQHYQDKVLALDASAQKTDLESIVAERGYSGEDESPPMAVTPPDDVVEATKESTPMMVVPPSTKEPVVYNVFEQTQANGAWDYHIERARRSPDEPYVIHYDERTEYEGYTDLTLTYYEADDVLCNDRDEIVDPVDREKMIGEKNLERFGHGSNDAAIVYIRNDDMQLVIEVVKSPNSYAEEVHGITHVADYRGNLERMREREAREEDG